MNLPSINLSLRQKEIATGLVVLFVCVGALVAGEAILRFQQILAFGTVKSVERSERYYIDEATGLRLPKPNTVHGQLRYNQQGFRSPEIVLPKPEGVRRIAYLGASTTLNAYVPNIEKIWPHLVTEQLRAAFPACTIDYVNGGVPGLSSGRLITLYEHFIAPMEPDLVIVLTNDQNVDLDDLAIAKGVHDGVHYRPSWLARNSLFWGKVEKNAVIIKRQREAYLTTGKLDFDASSLTQAFRERVTRLVSDIEASGAVPVLLSVGGQLRAGQTEDKQLAAVNTALFYMPYVSIDGLLRARNAYNSALSDVAGRNDVLMVDWQNEVPGDPKHFIDSIHFTPAGSRLMADYVAQTLIASPQTQALFGNC